MATIGKPAITTPRQFALSAVQQSVNNIRERIEAIERGIATLESSDTATAIARNRVERSLQSQIDELLRLIRNLQGDTDTANVFTVTLAAADGDIVTGAPVYTSGDGLVRQADPDTLADSSAYLGIAASDASDGNAVTVRLPGGVVQVPGSAFTIGRPLYAQLGGVTHSPPAGNSLPVGLAISTTEIAVGYGFNVLGDETFDPTGQDDMAVTRGLAGAGVGGVPVVTGEVPPALVYLDDGSLVYSPVED